MLGTNFKLVAKRIRYYAPMVRVSAWRHAMLFNGPCPFQAAGRHARCAGCGTVIRATVEDKYRVVLFADTPHTPHPTSLENPCSLNRVPNACGRISQ